MCVIYARFKKRRSRLHVQRNVVEETSDPSGYSEGFISRPPPPPYSAIDIHARGQEERIAQQEQLLPASMQPVVNFSENGDIEHEIYYPTIAVQLPENYTGLSNLETLGSDTTSDVERNTSNTEDTFYSENHRLLS